MRFAKKYILQIFSKVNLKTYCTYFFQASWNFLGQVHIWYHLLDGQVAEKVSFDP